MHNRTHRTAPAAAQPTPAAAQVPHNPTWSAVAQRPEHRARSAGGLPIGPTHAQAESAADQLAESALQRAARPAPKATAPSPMEDGPELPEAGGGVPTATNGAPPADPRPELGLGSGQPLPTSTRLSLEQGFGHDLSAVRVHTDDAGARAAQRVGASAFAIGQDVAFGAGRFRPETLSGARLLAHEVAHVVQGASIIRRQPPPGGEPRPADVPPPTAAAQPPTAAAQPPTAAVQPPTAAAQPSAAPAHSDEEVARLIGEVPQLNWVDMLAPENGGLTGLQNSRPLTHVALDTQLVGRYGNTTVRFLRANDARILRLVQRSNAIAARLAELYLYYWEHEQYAAADRIHQEEDHWAYSYAVAAERHRANGDFSLNIVEFFHQGTVAEITNGLEQQAEAAQRRHMEEERNRAEWTRLGRTLIGQKVAEREGIFWNDDVNLASLLEPEYGSETESQATVWARIAGRATAVRRVGDRWYVYGLNRDYGYGDVWETSQWQEHRSGLVPSGARRDRASLVTHDGYVLEPRSGRDGVSRYFGGATSGRPEEFLQASERLLAQQGATLSSEQAVRLFKRMVLDTLLVNLQNGERQLRAALDPLFEPGMPHMMMTMRPAHGEVMQRDSAALRRHLMAASEIAGRLPDNAEDATEEQRNEARITLEAIGRIYIENPAAALMVVDGRAPDERNQTAGEGDITDRLAGRQRGDAVWDTAQEISRRIDNINLVRRHFHSNPDAVLDLEPLHEPILNRFEGLNRIAIDLAKIGHTLGALARSLGLLVVDLGLLVTGFFTGGLTALVALGAGTALGVAGTAEQFRRAELLDAMSALDVEGGFQLATPQQASSARTWAWVSAGLTAVGVLGFVGSSVRMARLQAVLRDPAVGGLVGRTEEGLRRAARELGVSESQLVRQLRTATGAERTQLLASIRRATEPLVAGGRFGHSGWPADIADTVIEQTRQALLRNGDDVRQIERVMRTYGRGVDPTLLAGVDQGTLQTVKQYLFNSPGLAFTRENHDAWIRLTRGQGTVDDFRFILHEVEELQAFRRIDPRFDPLGRAWDTMTPGQRARWRTTFSATHAPMTGRYYQAHAQALEREYSFLAERVQAVTGHTASRYAIAVADELGGGARGGPLQLLRPDGVPFTSHRHFQSWQRQAQQVVELDAELTSRLGLTRGSIGRAPTLVDVVRAVKRQRIDL